MNDNSRVRIHIVGVVVTALFCSLFARLWFLQINESPTELNITNQSLRTIRTATSRGLIYDSEGRLLVGNKVSWSVVADPQLRLGKHDAKTDKARKRLVEKNRAAVVPKLAKLLGVNDAVLVDRLNSERLGPLEPVVIWADLKKPERIELAEHADQYPLVRVVALEVRWYQYPDAAPQTIGYLGPVDESDITKHANYGRSDLIGRSGLEAAYESVLRGEPSSMDVRVTPAGRIIEGEPENVDPGRPGYDVHLTLDADLQRFAQRSLQDGIDVAKSEQDEDLQKLGIAYQYRAPAGAVVVLDTTNGDVKAMVSNPGYNNSDKVVADFKALTDPAAHTPLVNRATSGLYAPGSTFKIISSIAMVQTGVRGINQFYNDTTCYQRPGLKKCSPAGANSVNLPLAITKSADVYFYSVGDELWRRWKAGDVQSGYAIQNTARAFGFGQKTHIEIGESSGTVPDQTWKQELSTALHPPSRDKSNADNRRQRIENGAWVPGDNISLAVGQGDLLVTPLQLANAYSTLANGGTRWRPRLVSAVTNANGKPVPGAPGPHQDGHVDIPDAVRNALLEGFRGVTTSPNGTGYAAFQGLTPAIGTVYGKTGTAQRGAKKEKRDKDPAGCAVPTSNAGYNIDKCIGDTSWFVSMYAPAGTDQQHPRYVVLAMVEEGGRGGRIAAPIVRQIIEHMSRQSAITPIPHLLSSGLVKG